MSRASLIFFLPFLSFSQLLNFFIILNLCLVLNFLLANVYVPLCLFSSLFIYFVPLFQTHPYSMSLNSCDSKAQRQ